MIPKMNEIPKLLKILGLAKTEIELLMEQVEYFNNEAKIRDVLINSYFDRECINKLLNEIVSEITNIEKNKMKILDIAAGTGFFLELISKRLKEYGKNIKCYGLDITPGMLLMLRKRGIIPIWGISDRIKESIILNRVYGDNRIPLRYDVIISTLSFHHFLNPLNVLKSMKDVLVNDGIIIIVDILKYENKELKERMKDVYAGFTVDEMNRLCRNYFSNVHVHVLENIYCRADEKILIGLFKAVIKMD